MSLLEGTYVGTEGWSKGGRSETAGMRATTEDEHLGVQQGAMNGERGSDVTATHHAV